MGNMTNRRFNSDRGSNTMDGSIGKKRLIQVLAIFAGILFVLYISTLLLSTKINESFGSFDELAEMAEAGGVQDIDVILSNMKENNSKYNYKATIALIEILKRLKFDGGRWHYTGSNEVINKKVTEVISKVDPEPILKALSVTLRDDTKEVKILSLYILEKVESDKKYSMFEETLNEEDKYVRLLAIRELGRSGDTKYFDTFKALLDSEERIIVDRAVTALGDLGDPRALEYFPALIKKFEDYERVQNVIRAISNIKDPRGVKLITPMVYNRNSSLRRSAILALGEIGGEEALEKLIEIVRGEVLWDTSYEIWIEDVAGRDALIALVKIGEPAIGPLLEIYEQSEGVGKEKIGEVLVKLGEPGLMKEALEKKLDQEEMVYPNKFGFYYEAGPPVGYFISRLSSREDRERKQAIVVLGWLGDKKAVLPLAKLLINKNEKVEFKISIAKSLSLIGDERAVDYLSDFTNHENQDLKKSIKKAIEEIKISPDINELKRNLSDSDTWVRKRVVIHLGKLGASENPEVSKLLISALADKHKWVRGEAAWTYGKLKEKKALPHLKRLLNDKSIWVRRGAVFAIGEILHGKGNGSLSAVLPALEDEHLEVKRMALMSIGKIGGSKAVSILMKYMYNRELVDAAVEGLVNCRDAAIVPLGKITKSDDRVKRYITLIILKKMHSQKALEFLIEMIKDEDEEIRTVAVSSMMFYDEKITLEYLIAATDDEFSDVRTNAVFVMGANNIERAVPTLLEKMKNDPEENVRANAAWALGRIGSEETIKELMDALKSGTNDVRENSAWALGRIGNVKAVPVLEKALLDPEKKVRTEAAWALGTIGDSRSIEALKAVLPDNDKNHLVKFAVETSINRISNPKNIKSLSRGVLFAYTSISYNSVISLGDLESKSNTKYIALALLNDESLTREMAAEVLGSIGDRHAVGSLIEALNDKESTVRWFALKSLREISKENFGNYPSEWELWWEAQK